MWLNVSPSILATLVALHGTALCYIDKSKLLSTVSFTTLIFKILVVKGYGEGKIQLWMEVTVSVWMEVTVSV